MSLLLLLRVPVSAPVYRPDPPARPSRPLAAEHAALVGPEIRPARPAAVARPN
ncbi:MAG: hypothetical protein O9320_08825 [Magnetospirillum sp.]|nr:hypothetical protein [Magnetospirillum sp.]